MEGLGTLRIAKKVKKIANFELIDWMLAQCDGEHDVPERLLHHARDLVDYHFSKDLGVELLAFV